MTKSQRFAFRVLYALLTKWYEYSVDTSYRASAPWGVS